MSGPSYENVSIDLNDDKELELWLDDQVRSYERHLQPLLPFDDIKAALQEWLNPEGEDEEGAITPSEPGVAFDSRGKRRKTSIKL